MTSPKSRRKASVRPAARKTGKSKKPARIRRGVSQECGAA